MFKNILISGGCGFLAKGLVKYLLRQKNINKIICVDNFITSNENDFHDFRKKYDINNKIILHIFDVTKYNLMEIMLNEINISHKIKVIHEIYHLASLASPSFYKQFPMETLDVGYIGTKVMLEIAKRFNSRILFSSTSEVYGDPNVFPQNENYYGNVNSFGARSCYDESKRIAESLCYTYIQEHNLDVKIARIFNTYGPEMLISDGRIVTETIRHLQNNTILSIYGDGKQTRCCCNISDTVEMLIELMASDCNIPVNIGNDYELSVNKIVDIIENVYRLKFNKDIILRKQYKPLTQNDPLKRQPCLKLNKKILGERKYVTLEEGIEEMITYFEFKLTK